MEINNVKNNKIVLYLQEVARLQESLGVEGDVSYTCETAAYFYLYQVLSRWEEYMSKIKPHKGSLFFQIYRHEKESIPIGCVLPTCQRIP